MNGGGKRRPGPARDSVEQSALHRAGRAGGSPGTMPIGGSAGSAASAVQVGRGRSLRSAESARRGHDGGGAAGGGGSRTAAPAERGRAREPGPAHARSPRAPHRPDHQIDQPDPRLQ